MKSEVRIESIFPVIPVPALAVTLIGKSPKTQNNSSYDEYETALRTGPRPGSRGGAC